MRFTGKSSSRKEYGNNPTRRYYMDYEGSPSNNYIKGNEEKAMAQYLPHTHEDLNSDFQIQVEKARYGLCVCNPNTAMGNWGMGTG